MRGPDRHRPPVRARVEAGLEMALTAGHAFSRPPRWAKSETSRPSKRCGAPERSRPERGQQCVRHWIPCNVSPSSPRGPEMHSGAASGTEELLIAMQTPAPRGHLGVPTLLWGQPGEGKTSFVEALDRPGFPVVTLIASIHDPTDFSGLPVYEQQRMVELRASRVDDAFRRSPRGNPLPGRTHNRSTRGSSCPAADRAGRARWASNRCRSECGSSRPRTLRRTSWAVGNSHRRWPTASCTSDGSSPG